MDEQTHIICTSAQQEAAPLAMSYVDDGFTAQYKQYKLQQYLRTLGTESEKPAQEQHAHQISVPSNVFQKQSANAERAGAELAPAPRPAFILQRIRRPFTAALQDTVGAQTMQPSTAWDQQPSRTPQAFPSASWQQLENFRTVLDFTQENYFSEVSTSSWALAAEDSRHVNAGRVNAGRVNSDNNEEMTMTCAAFSSKQQEPRANKSDACEIKVSLIQWLHAQTDVQECSQ